MKTLIILVIVFGMGWLPSCKCQEVETAQLPTKDPDAIPTIESFGENKLRYEGYLPFYWDAAKGKIYLEIARPAEEFLYVHSLATGLGSNPVGLDRGQLGDQKVVRFERVGPKVLLIHRNLRFRAITENKLEQRAVEQSFAQSVLWGGEIVAESDGKFVIDISDFILSDVHGVVATLKQTDQGDYSLDAIRSAVFLERCKAFPQNTELESTLTFSSQKPGSHVRQTTPTPKAISLRQHHSFIKLPDENYRPRVYDVRSPCIFVTFADYASPLDQSLEHRWITRHRLEKQHPDVDPSEADLSEVVEPIVYYVDAGAPKQIQDALIEGASWWNDAFEAAGFKDAFQVKLLPPDADPLDVRFNVIQWVHRSTRGWSYGGSVIDPRTGEIIKGHVTLGSLRVRQDQLLVNSLVTAPPSMRCACCGIGGIAEEATLADLAVGGNALDVALARIRQLSAHEVGHTLGFVHNFAASTYADRASVMDYPAPRVKVNEKHELDLSDAYAVGIGDWDKVAVKFAYSQFDQVENEELRLNQILESAKESKMLFLSDADARPAGAAHPLANLWDNGADPLTELKHVMRVRRIALDRFDPAQLPSGTTTGDIGQYLTPIYLHHRYQLQAAGKLIGGHNYEYGYVGSKIQRNVPVHSDIQKQAIAALLETITPKQLMLDPDLIQTISPRPYSSIRDQEILPAQSGRIFDPTAAAKVAANLTLDELLQHQRLNRLIHQSNLNGPDPSYIMDQLIEKNWLPLPNADDQANQLSRVVREAIVDHLIELADNPDAGTDVRAAAISGLRQIQSHTAGEDGPASRFTSMIQRRIQLFLARPFTVMPNPQQPKVPPGSPIGSKN